MDEKNHPRPSSSWKNRASLVFALLGLYRFSTAFFLAKKALTESSACADNSASVLLSSALGLSDDDIHSLHTLGLLSSHNSHTISTTTSSNGCWMPRRVDALAVIVVDALRFDFALDSLPLSIGTRLPSDPVSRNILASHNINGSSQLFQFIADPPTVTMQRIKGMTTGGLPTFMDISSNLGGATMEEDSWVDQFYKVSPLARWGYAAWNVGPPNNIKLETMLLRNCYNYCCSMDRPFLDPRDLERTEILKHWKSNLPSWLNHANKDKPNRTFRNSSTRMQTMRHQPNIVHKFDYK